ncbi:MAG: hypothetical protein JNK15_11045 [Planctomycetes bacterium]|nr:hypothetical protein [Planctomycetota bacterium]
MTRQSKLIKHAEPAPPAKRAGADEAPQRHAQEIPLADREALTLPEASMLGYGSERLLRHMIRTGDLKRCVLQVGKRGIRLLRKALIEELQARH